MHAGHNSKIELWRKIIGFKQKVDLTEKKIVFPKIVDWIMEKNHANDTNSRLDFLKKKTSVGWIWDLKLQNKNRCLKEK